MIYIVKIMYIMYRMRSRSGYICSEYIGHGQGLIRPLDVGNEMGISDLSNVWIILHDSQIALLRVWYQVPQHRTCQNKNILPAAAVMAYKRVKRAERSTVWRYSQKFMPIRLDTSKTFFAISTLTPPDSRKVLHS